MPHYLQVVSPEYKYFCSSCASPRPDDVCWKCEGVAHVPPPQWDNPKLPPIDLIRELGKQVSYVITPHGSGQRDLDLVAMAWEENAVTYGKLIEHLCEHLDARQAGDIEIKPWRRIAVTLQMNGWYKPIDLSIGPLSDLY